MFDSSVDDGSDDTVYDALVESYEKLRGNLLRNGILEAKPKRMPIVEYIPSAQEIRHALDGLPKTIRVEAEQFNVFDVLDVALKYILSFFCILQAACETWLSARPLSSASVRDSLRSGSQDNCQPLPCLQ